MYQTFRLLQYQNINFFINRKLQILYEDTNYGIIKTKVVGDSLIKLKNLNSIKNFKKSYNSFAKRNSKMFSLFKIVINYNKISLMSNLFSKLKNHSWKIRFWSNKAKDAVKKKTLLVFNNSIRNFKIGRRGVLYLKYYRAKFKFRKFKFRKIRKKGRKILKKISFTKFIKIIASRRSKRTGRVKRRFRSFDPLSRLRTDYLLTSNLQTLDVRELKLNSPKKKSLFFIMKYDHKKYLTREIEFKINSTKINKSKNTQKIWGNLTNLEIIANHKPTKTQPYRQNLKSYNDSRPNFRYFKLLFKGNKNVMNHLSLENLDVSLISKNKKKWKIKKNSRSLLQLNTPLTKTLLKKRIKGNVKLLHYWRIKKAALRKKAKFFMTSLLLNLVKVSGPKYNNYLVKLKVARVSGFIETSLKERYDLKILKNKRFRVLYMLNRVKKDQKRIRFLNKVSKGVFYKTNTNSPKSSLTTKISKFLKLNSYLTYFYFILYKPFVFFSNLTWSYFKKITLFNNLKGGRSYILNEPKNTDHLLNRNKSLIYLQQYKHPSVNNSGSAGLLILKFLENMSGFRFWISQTKIGYLDYLIRGNGFSLLTSRMMNRYYYRFNRKIQISSIIKVLYISLLTQDLELLRYTSKYALKRLRVHEQRHYFQLINYALKYHFSVVFPELGVQGYHYEVKGKIGLKGKARKKKIQTKLLKSSRSRFTLKVIELDEVFSSDSGALSFRLSVYY